MFKQMWVFIFLIVLLPFFLLREGVGTCEYTGERIIYAITPFGTAEYNDLGSVELEGKIVNLITFKTQIFGFSDTEKIYSIGGDLSPVKLERDVTTWLGKENLIEEYDPQTFTLTIQKFKDNRKIKDYVFKEDGPIYNAILLLFYLRKIPEIDNDWTLEVRIPNKFKVYLDSIEEIEVPAGKFMAYHFRCSPNKFEIWISKDKPHTPLKIKTKGGFGYTALMEEHSFSEGSTFNK